MLDALGPRRLSLPLFGAVLLLLSAILILFLPSPYALIAVGTAALAVAVLLRPPLALCLLVPAIPFGSLFPLPLGGANVTAADGLLILAFAMWLAQGIARRRILIRAASLLIPFIVFILAVGLSLTVALSLQASAKELLKWVEMLLAYWLVVQWSPKESPPPPAACPAQREKRRLAYSGNSPLLPLSGERGRGLRTEAFLGVIFLAGLAEALVGVYQSIGGVGPAGFSLLGGTRAFGTFDQPNPFAGYLNLIIPLAFGTGLGLMALGRRLFSKGNLALLALATVALAACLAALYFSLSRGAWLGAAAALAAVFVIRSRRTALLGAGLGALIAAIVLLGQLNLIPDVISSRFAGVSDYFSIQDVRGVKVTDENFAIVERMAHWEAGLAMFEDHPWLGVGFGNYAAAYPAYALPHWDDPLGHAHNYYINVLAESGMIGFAGYMVLWLSIFWLAWRSVRRTRGAAQGIAAGALGVLIALSVHNLFDNLFVHSMQIQVGITLGLIEGLASKEVSA